MNRPMRGNIKQLKKIARQKDYAVIADRIWTVIFKKKELLSLRLRDG